MQIYRVYTMTPKGHIDKPPQVIELSDDDAAVHHAWQLLDGKPIEVWEGARRIARLEPGEGKHLQLFDVAAGRFYSFDRPGRV